jgi:hypothetical protein
MNMQQGLTLIGAVVGAIALVALLWWYSLRLYKKYHKAWYVVFAVICTIPMALALLAVIFALQGRVVETTTIVQGFATANYIVPYFVALVVEGVVFLAISSLHQRTGSRIIRWLQWLTYAVIAITGFAMIFATLQHFGVF